MYTNTPQIIITALLSAAAFSQALSFTKNPPNRNFISHTKSSSSSFSTPSSSSLSLLSKKHQIQDNDHSNQNSRRTFFKQAVSTITFITTSQISPPSSDAVEDEKNMSFAYSEKCSSDISREAVVTSTTKTAKTTTTMVKVCRHHQNNQSNGNNNGNNKNMAVINTKIKSTSSIYDKVKSRSEWVMQNVDDDILRQMCDSCDTDFIKADIDITDSIINTKKCIEFGTKCQSFTRGV